MNREAWRLVFVRDSWAWFTDDLEGARGDDWDDAPHCDNAGTPYEDRGNFYKVAYDGDFEMAGTTNLDQFGYLSVKQINAGEGPWLYKPSYGLPQFPEPLFVIPGGVTLKNFRILVRMGDGRVYEEGFDQLRDLARAYLEATAHFPGVNWPGAAGGVGAAAKVLRDAVGWEAGDARTS